MTFSELLCLYLHHLPLRKKTLNCKERRSSSGVPSDGAGRWDAGGRRDFSSTLSFNDFLEVLFDCRPEAQWEGVGGCRAFLLSLGLVPGWQSMSLCLLYGRLFRRPPPFFYWRKWCLEAQTGCPAGWPGLWTIPPSPLLGLHSSSAPPPRLLQLHSLWGK